MYTLLAPVPEPGTGYEPTGQDGYADLAPARDQAFELAARNTRYGPCTYLVCEDGTNNVWSVTVDPGRDGSPALLRVVHDGREQKATWWWGAEGAESARKLRKDDWSKVGSELQEGELARLFVDVDRELGGPFETTEATADEVRALTGGADNA